MSQAIWKWASVTLAMAIIAGVTAWRLLQHGHAFSSNLLVNCSAGLGILAVGLFITERVAAQFARQKLQRIASTLLDPIEQLRVERELSPEAAHRLVKCCVALVSDLGFRDFRVHGNTATGPKEACRVCSKTITVDKGRCTECGLEGSAWRPRDERKPTNS